MEIFRITKSFPPEEQYSLSSQIRRSSRSVCSNLAEGYRKRRYKPHFISKISDADMENSETETWINFAFSCKYINEKTSEDLKNKTEEIGKLLSHIMKNPDRYIGDQTRV